MKTQKIIRIFAGVTMLAFTISRTAAAGSPPVLPADPLDTWVWRNPLPTGNTLHTVAYGNGSFVAVGDAGAVLVSTDATNWTLRSVPTGNSLAAITYGNGKFVAVGNAALYSSSATIIVSTDATNWISPFPAANNALYAVAFGNGTFVAVGHDETIVTSTDGTNWVKRREMPSGLRLAGVAYGNGLFMATAYGSGVVLVSSDAVNWVARPPFGSSFRSIAFGNGVFLARNDEWNLVTSTDGLAWSISPLVTYAPIFTFDSARFVLFSSGGGGWNAAYTSADGLNWDTTNYFYLSNGSFSTLIFEAGKYVAVVGGRLASSTDLSQWSLVGTSLPIASAKVFLHGNGKSVLAGEGPILVSSDGVHYHTNATSVTSSAGAFGAGTFMLTAGGSTVVTSTNGSDWFGQVTGVGALNGLAYGSNTFIAVGNSGVIRVSTDGTSWSERFSRTGRKLMAVTYGQGLFAIVGAGGTILTSPDTVTWTPHYVTTATLRSIAHANGVFVAVGGDGIILMSANGTDWDFVDSGTTDSLWTIVAARGNWLVAGGGTVLTSLDGRNWRPRRVPLRSLGAAATPKTFLLFGAVSRAGAGIMESGELSPIGLFGPSFHPVTGFHLTVTGDTGSVARLQRSTNLVDWQDVLTFTNSGTPIPLADPGVGNSSRSFYRVVAP